MKRPSIIAALITIVVHAAALASLSLWSVGAGDAGQAESTLPEPEAALAHSTGIPTAGDTLSLPLVMPQRVPPPNDTAASARPLEPSRAAARPARRTEVTPVLMLSWQKGGGRRKTLGSLPTLSGPLLADVTASFKVMVAPDGKVRTVRVVKGKNAAFERAAATRIKQWRFEPVRASRSSDQLCTVTLRARAR